MTLRERLLATRLLESLKKHPEYGKRLQIEVTVPSKYKKQSEKEKKG